MKITVSINLGGHSFTIDEDAYAELQSYLKKLEIHLANDESSSEILSDIETRIAELFRSRLNSYKQVINIDDVNQVVSTLGKPEDISDNDISGEGKRSSSSGYHRMYRDPDHRIIGGVCAGTGAYWNIEPWIIRLSFFILTMMGGIGALVYLILYIVLPEARTRAQKIEMKGEPVNIRNIRDSVKKEINTIRKRMNL
jgi:phage shock protein PspC (stress-responsive transcriptional regulator)